MFCTKGEKQQCTLQTKRCAPAVRDIFSSSQNIPSQKVIIDLAGQGRVPVPTFHRDLGHVLQVHESLANAIVFFVSKAPTRGSNKQVI